MRFTSMIACALLTCGLIAWAGCDNADNARTGNDTNNTAPDARTAGDRTTPTDTGTTGDAAGRDQTTGTGATGSDTTGTSGTGTATPTTAPSDTTGGTGTSGAGSPR